MGDNTDVTGARELANTILRAWETIHGRGEVRLVALITEAVADALFAEWEQWLVAVSNIGTEYIENSDGFVEGLTGDRQKVAQETWDAANSTFDEILARRWRGPILAHVFRSLHAKRDELKSELAAEINKRCKPPPPPPPPKKHKLRRKNRPRGKHAEPGVDGSAFSED